MPSPTDAARDRIAEMCGYVYKTTARGGEELWHQGSYPFEHHPIPARLDFVSRVWPDGWEWTRHSNDWHVYNCGPLAHLIDTIEIVDTGDELTDRLTLTVKVLEHLQAHDRPAFDAAVAKIRKEIQG